MFHKTDTFCATTHTSFPTEAFAAFLRVLCMIISLKDAVKILQQLQYTVQREYRSMVERC